MKYENIGVHKTIDGFVKHKLNMLNDTDKSFKSLFDLMFSESNAVFYERSEGYRIVKTTYGEAKKNALRRAEVLKQLLSEAPQNSVVGIHLNNSAEWIEALWAVLAAGFCPLLLNLRLDSGILNNALSDCHAVAVISEGSDFQINTIAPEELSKEGRCELPEEFGNEIFLMSTGTSAKVKICGYGSEQFCCQVNDSFDIVKSCAQIKKNYKGHIKLLTFLPFYHIFGLIAVYVWFTFFACTLVHLQNMEPQTILNTVRRHEVTHIFAIPLFWEKTYDQAMRTINERGEATVNK